MAWPSFATSGKACTALAEFHQAYKQACGRGPPGGGRGGWEVPGAPDWEQLDALLAAAAKEVDHAHGRIQKHAAVLLRTQAYTVQLGAGRVTHCKSGKDRTGAGRPRSRTQHTPPLCWLGAA